MKMHILILTTLLSFFSSLVLAQNAGSISGRISGAGEKGIAASGATVALLRAKDSATIKFSVAAKDGSYMFENLPAGKYLVAITAVGYKKIFSAPVELDANKTSAVLPVLELVTVPKSMDAITVTAKRPLIEQKIDRTIVNVEASITNAGTTALDVLEKSPGITVDRDGNISLKGKDGVLVMIDGRPTQLSGADLANLLRNMSSGQMDQVEIMTNPPARYDAAGNAGIINIKTKKTKVAGYNGSANLNYTQGRYPKFSEGLNFNYREGKVNLFTSLNHNYNKNFETLSIQRNIRSAAGLIQSHFDQTAHKIREANSRSARIGLDYFASNKTSFGFMLNGAGTDGSADNRNVTNILTPAKEPVSVTKAGIDDNSRWRNYGLNLNFRTVFDSTGRELNSEIDYLSYGSTNRQFMVNAYSNATGNAPKADSLEGILPQDITVYSGRVDYFHPLKKGAKFEAGVKTSIVRTDNNVSYDSIQYGRVIHDLHRSNHFIYEENINAAYANLSGSISKKISAQLGLRLENTNATGNQLTTGQNFDRHYSQLFPTAYLQYKADDKNNLVLNYGRRLRRPNYESLNPFIKFIDRYTYTQGNPDLKPSFSHNVELTHSYKNLLTTTLNYTATTDIFQGVLEQRGEEAYMKQSNIASLRQVGISVNSNQPITKWWTSNVYMNVFYNRFEGLVNSTPVSVAATSFSINGSQQFKVSGKLTAELNGNYRTPGVQGVMKMKGMGMLSAGFSQQVLKNQGTLRLTVRDLLYSQRASATTRYGNVDAAFQEIRDSRTVNIGFSYRFSKGKINNQKKKTNGSAGEEQNRIGADL